MDFYSLCSYSQCIINVLVLLAYKWKKPISWALNGCMLPVGTDLYCFYVFLCIWVVGWVSVLRLDSFNVIRSHVWVLLLWMMSIYIRNDGVDLFNVVSARSDQPRWSSSGQEKITLHSSSFNLKVKPSFSFFPPLFFCSLGRNICLFTSWNVPFMLAVSVGCEEVRGGLQLVFQSWTRAVNTGRLP